MKKGFLKGNIAISLSRRISKKYKRKIYILGFSKEGAMAAEVYFHPAAKTYTLDTVDTVLIKQTLREIMQFMNIATFRFTRRRIQAFYRNQRLSNV